MLDELERSILEKLTFEEKLYHLIQEIDEKEPVVIDVLKSLLARDLVQAFYYDDETKTAKQTAFYDGDNMGEFMYRITKKGIDVLY